MYNVNPTQSKNHKNKYFYTYDSETSLTDANVSKKIRYVEIDYKKGYDQSLLNNSWRTLLVRQSLTLKYVLLDLIDMT